MSGSNTFALSYDARSTLSLRTELGSWFDRQVLLEHGKVLALRARAAWAYDHSDNAGQGRCFKPCPAQTSQ